jgi:hypothetical protein
MAARQAEETPISVSTSTPVHRYLDLMAEVLTRHPWVQDELLPARARNWKRPLLDWVQAVLKRRGYVLASRRDATAIAEARQRRREGKDWPPTAETMVGLRRLAKRSRARGAHPRRRDAR